MRELVVLCVTAALLLFYGLVPFRVGHAILSAPKIGLVGADEPRYAQIAVEMLEEHSTVCHELGARVIPHSLRITDLKASFHCAEAGTITPILYGRPWLEKPALYYWRTMSFYKEFGKSDWAARLSSATGAFALVFLIFLHMPALPSRRPPGRGADHHIGRRHHRVCPWRVDGHAVGRAVLHRHAGLVCMV